jgi:hypothetical protein
MLPAIDSPQKATLGRPLRSRAEVEAGRRQPELDPTFQRIQILAVEWGIILFESVT